ncbi:MAG TPA: trypsin-like peptidase domain-containing protein [Planctomycetota bacterium]|nr:trypsin-like peptidase domain-containing protein [Planctomycetota bacterium]
MRLKRAFLALAALAAAAAGGSAAQETPASSSAEEPAAILEDLYQKAAERAAPCVVAIKVDREPEAARPTAPAPPRAPATPGRFAGAEDVFARRPAGAWCTGTIVDPAGVIVTTCFNVAGRVRSIVVRLPDGRELPGTLLGSDATCDLAAIRVEAEGLPVLERAPLEALRPGQAVLALGRAPDGRALTVNPGIVSASSRLAGRALQTDARLNFGNVGGPLVDARGRLLGITCKVDTKPGISSTRGQNSGVGFALAHDRLYGELLGALRSGRRVEEARRPFLGIEHNAKSSVTDGVELAAVQAGSAAERAGLRPGDVIVAFDGKRTQFFEQLKEAILARSPGDRVQVRVRRRGEELELECELGWAPGE